MFLKSLEKRSSSSTCFSGLVTSGNDVRVKLEELDDSLRNIGHLGPPTKGISETARAISSDVSSKCDNAKKSHLLSGVKGPKNYIDRVHRHDFNRIRTLGKGCYSDVQMVQNHKGEYLALKALNSSRIKTPEILITAAIDLGMEAAILSELNHENIIQLRGICSSNFSSSYTEGTDEGYFLVLDLMEDILSDRLERWRNHSWRLSAFEYKWLMSNPKVNINLMYERMQSVALGILEGMIYLHKQGIVIRDLKPANIGFDKDGNVRLFDFGMARKLEDCDHNEMCGSLRYMAPEVMGFKGYSFKTDVYSIGVILYELCSLTVAFDAIKKYSSIQEFSRFIVEFNLRPKLNRIGCPLTTTLIEDCWHTDPTKRPSCEEIYTRIVDITSYKNGTTTSCNKNKKRASSAKKFKKSWKKNVPS